MEDIENEISVKSLKNCIKQLLNKGSGYYSDKLVEKLLFSEEPIVIGDMVTTYPSVWEFFYHEEHLCLLKIELIKDIDKVSSKEFKKIL